MYKVDETVCGPLCQHPGCWQSNLRQAKGFPRHAEQMSIAESEEEGLPTLKICNLLDDDDDDHHPYTPPFYSMQSQTGSMPSLLGDAGIAGLPAAKPPNTTPSSARISPSRSGRKPEIKLVEVQEVFDLHDLGSTWDATFVAKKYLVWVPNPMKTPRKHRQLDPIDTDSMKRLNKDPFRVAPKDLTEDMMPRKIERQRTDMVTKHRSRSRSPPSRSRYNVSKTTRKPAVDSDGMSDLLSLPRDMLLEVLDKSKESDFTTREKVQNLIKRTFPLYDRSFTNASLDSMEIFKQQKMTILDAKSRTSYKELTESKPVFILDSGQQGPSRADTPEHRADMMSDYDSMRESYSLKDYTMEKNRKAIPNLLAHQLLDRHRRAVPRVPSISLGLPELPSGMRHIRTTNYKRKDLDFSLGPVPTLPSSARSTETPGSDHGTTVRVHAKSEGSEEFSDMYPYGGPYSDRGSARNRMFHQPLHKDFGGQVRANSPSHPIRAPVNTPNTQQALSPEPTANLDIITETSPDLRIYVRSGPKSGTRKAPMNAKRGSPSPNRASSKSPSKGMSTTSANEEKLDSRATSKSPPQSEGNCETPNMTESMSRLLIEERAMDTPGPPPPSPDFKKMTTPMKAMDAYEDEDEDIPMREPLPDKQIGSTVAENEQGGSKSSASDEVGFVNPDLQNVEHNAEDTTDVKVPEIPGRQNNEVESTKDTDSLVKTVLKNEPQSAEESQSEIPNRDTGHDILSTVDDTVPEKTSQEGTEDVKNSEADANSNAQAGVISVDNAARETEEVNVDNTEVLIQMKSEDVNVDNTEVHIQMKSEDVNTNAQIDESINIGDGVDASNTIDQNSSGDKQGEMLSSSNGDGNDTIKGDTLLYSEFVVDANQGEVTQDNEGKENDVQMNVESHEPHLDNEAEHDDPHLDNKVECDQPHVDIEAENDEHHVDNKLESVKLHVDNKLENVVPHVDSTAESVEPHVDSTAESVEPHVNSTVETDEPYVDSTAESFEPHVNNKSESVEPHVGSTEESVEPHVDSTAESVEPHVDSTAESVVPHVDSTAESVEPHVNSTVETDEPYVDSTAESFEPHVNNKSESVEPHVGSTEESVEPHVDSTVENDEPHVDSTVENDDLHVDNMSESEFRVDSNLEIGHVDMASEKTKLVQGTDQINDEHVTDIEYHAEDDNSGLENTGNNIETSQTIEGDESVTAIMLTESSENVDDSVEARNHNKTLKENVEQLNENKTENVGKKFEPKEDFNGAYVNAEDEVISNKRTVNDDAMEGESTAYNDGPNQQDHLEITEDGGDNEAFKDELRDELRRLSEED